ncbi:MAG: C40 family peptidase, partial [Lysobacter sp.]|nr:C40 family peptidase [Lysobacter sp.]
MRHAAACAEGRNSAKMPTVSMSTHYPHCARRAPIAAVALFAIVVLTGCGRDDVRPTPHRSAVVPQRDWPQMTPADPASANAVLIRAISLVGTPYRYGGNTPEGGFDCSGLVNYVYQDMLDLRLPRTS